MSDKDKNDGCSFTGNGKSPKYYNPPWWARILVVILPVLIIWILSRPEEETIERNVQMSKFSLPRGAEQTDVPVAKEFQDKDDLTLIKGIGPVIQKTLNNNGVFTFSQLAKLDHTITKEMINSAGVHLANTSSWQEQARLVSSGNMEALRAFQQSI